MHWFLRAVVSLVALVLGLACSLGIWISGWKGDEIDWAILQWPGAIPPYLVLFVWSWLLGMAVSATTYAGLAQLLRSSRLRRRHARNPACAD